MRFPTLMLAMFFGVCSCNRAAQVAEREEKWRQELKATLEPLARQCVHVGESISDTEGCLSRENSKLNMEGTGTAYVERRVGNQIGILGVQFDQTTQKIISSQVYVRKWEGHWQN